MNELKKYLSPMMGVIVMEEQDVITLSSSNPETNLDNDNVFEDVYD